MCSFIASRAAPDVTSITLSIPKPTKGNTASNGSCDEGHNPFKNVPEDGEVFESVASTG